MELEDPTESLREDIHHHATHAAHGGHGPGEADRFPLIVGLAAALLAALAAVTSMLSGHHADEAMIEQIQASDEWNLYQAKSIKTALLQTKGDLLVAQGKAALEEDTKHLAEYKGDLDEAKKTATEREEGYRHHIHIHHVLSRAVTLFQVGIALAAIAVLTRRRMFLFVALGFAAIGVFFLVQGLLL